MHYGPMLARLTHPCLPEKADRRTRESHGAQLIQRLHKDPAPQVSRMKKKKELRRVMVGMEMHRSC